MEGFDYGFNKIFVLKSLGETDTYADDLYYNTIEPCCNKVGLATESPINLYEPEDWDKAIEQMLNDEHCRPLVHVEMHGNEIEGLKLRLGGFVSWKKMLDDLRKVNVKSGMNLIVTMATCYSKQTLFDINMSGQAAPYLFSITEKKEIKAEITYAFYSIFFEELIATSSLYDALKRIEKERPDLPPFFVLATLPFLFEDAWRRVPELYNSDDEVVRHFIHTFPSFQSKVIQNDISREEFEEYKEGFVRECNADTLNAIYRRCMATFFMFDQYPSNRQRFRLSDCIV